MKKILCAICLLIGISCSGRSPIEWMKNDAGIIKQDIGQESLVNSALLKRFCEENAKCACKLSKNCDLSKNDLTKEIEHMETNVNNYIGTNTKLCPASMYKMYLSCWINLTPKFYGNASKGFYIAFEQCFKMKHENWKNKYLHTCFPN